MSKFINKISKTAGLAPGTPVHVGKTSEQHIGITVIDYNGDIFEERELNAIEDSFQFRDKETVSWINIDGVHNTDIVVKIGEHFKLHPLVLEDIVNTSQRPKIEDFEDYIFMVLKMIYKSEGEFVAEQVSIVLGRNYVISFQEKKGDVFEGVRERIRKAKGRVRDRGADYLAYALIDSIVDNYFITLEEMGEKIEKVEDRLVKNPVPRSLQTIHEIKRDLLFLRKSIWPLREVINGLLKDGTSLVRTSSIVYLRDLYDHAVQVIDTIETFRDMAAGMLEIYMSSISNRMNEVMKVLTIFASIFIPLTFVAGVYGMNFKYMPGLEDPWGYYIMLGIMAVIGIFMLILFKRRKWL